MRAVSRAEGLPLPFLEHFPRDSDVHGQEIDALEFAVQLSFQRLQQLSETLSLWYLIWKVLDGRGTRPPLADGPRSQDSPKGRTE